MNRNDYKPRIIDRQLKEYLMAFGAVCIEGPKWCGKTWTAAYHSSSQIMLGDPSGNFQNRSLAELSPELILEGEKPRLIDEWQEVPPIWDAVRFRVDQSKEKGQYILTGSATPNHKGILHSGAGRIGRLHMRPMSLYESGISSGIVSLEDLCKGDMKPAMTGEVRLEELAEQIVRGGWPGSMGLPRQEALLVPPEYLRAVIEDDVFRVDGIRRDTDKMQRLLRSLARNESTTATNRKLQEDIKAVDADDIDMNTLMAYLDIFRRLFLIEEQPPFSSNIRSSLRVKQAAKRHFCDPSLACALLGLKPQALIQDLHTFGFLFEALCERDLRIYAESFGAQLYHYQNYKNQEIDAVVMLPDGTWAAFEIKLGANQIDAAAENLKAVSREIEKEKGAVSPAVLCVLCGLSNAAYRRTDGVFVVPITALKN